MTDEFKKDIETARSGFVEKKEVEMREKDCFRFETEVNTDSVVVPAVD